MSDGSSVGGGVRRTRRGESVPASWRRVTRGVRCRSSPGDDLFRLELRAWQEVLPAEARWTHLTAARLYGWWLPPLPAATPVFAAHSAGHRPRRPGMVSIRQSMPGRYEEMDGLRVAPPAETIAACARDLSELDLTCLVAAALAAGSCPRAELAALAAQPRRGMRTLRRVLSWVDHRHESIWEVLLAELHRACGIEVIPQHRVYADDGDFIARGDLWLVGTRRLHEYDGEHHGERRQRAKDLRREGRLTRARWTRRGYVSEDVLHGAVHVLADADHALGRPHEPARIRAWHTVLRPSLFTPYGRAAFQQRISPGT